MLYVTR